MAEYIERESLQTKLNWKKPGAVNKRYTDGWNDAVFMFKSMVHSAKAADVLPVRHGRWVNANNRKKTYQRRCTSCGEIAYYCGIGCSYKFCPNCGCCMDGGVSDA